MEETFEEQEGNWKTGTEKHAGKKVRERETKRERDDKAIKDNEK